MQIKVNEAAPVPGAPPQAVINYPTEVRVGDQATFDGGQSIPGGSPIIGYDWDFGDGEQASGSRVTHVYDDPGSYEVNLRVTAEDGQQNRTNVRIKVIEIEAPEPPTPTPEEPDPTPTMPALPEPDINYPAEGRVGEPVTFDGSESRPGGNPIDSFAWDFGDGNSGEGAVAEHIYDAPGVYNVTLTVTDTEGFGNVGGPVQITINEAN